MKQYRTHPVVQGRIIEMHKAGLEPAIICERTGLSVDAIRYALKAEQKRQAKAQQAKRRDLKKAETLWQRITERSKAKGH